MKTKAEALTDTFAQGAAAGDTDGRLWRDMCRMSGAREELSRRVYMDGHCVFIRGDKSNHCPGDPIRFEYPDGSAIVVHDEAWYLEGQTPFLRQRGA